MEVWLRFGLLRRRRHSRSVSGPSTNWNHQMGFASRRRKEQRLPWFQERIARTNRVERGTVDRPPTSPPSSDAARRTESLILETFHSRAMGDANFIEPADTNRDLILVNHGTSRMVKRVARVAEFVPSATIIPAKQFRLSSVIIGIAEIITGLRSDLPTHWRDLAELRSNHGTTRTR